MTEYDSETARGEGGGKHPIKADVTAAFEMEAWDNGLAQGAGSATQVLPYDLDLGPLERLDVVGRVTKLAGGLNPYVARASRALQGLAISKSTQRSQ